MGVGCAKILQGGGRHTPHHFLCPFSICVGVHSKG